MTTEEASQEGNTKIVYLFWCENCYRCKLFLPVFETWAGKYLHADFVSVPLTDPYIARKLNISSVPTVVVVEDEKILAFIKRAPTEDEIARLLRQQTPSQHQEPYGTGKEER